MDWQKLIHNFCGERYALPPELQKHPAAEKMLFLLQCPRRGTLFVGEEPEEITAAKKGILVGECYSRIVMEQRCGC